MEQFGKTVENPLAIANFFVEKSLATGELLTPMKLVKLVYLAHGWYLGMTSEPLLTEGVEAWKYGPVVPSVYKAFKAYGGEPITALATSPKSAPQEFVPTVQDPELEAFLERMWEVYQSYTGLELSSLTHQSGTPWDQTWVRQTGRRESPRIIPNDLIQSYYQSKIDANRSEISA